MDLNFEQKYLKYKSKYLQTKQFGGIGGHLQVYFLTNDQYNELKNGNWVVSDPGRRCISYMKNKDGITYRYTNRMHMNKTKRLKYQKLIKNYKDKKEITKIINSQVTRLLISVRIKTRQKRLYYIILFFFGRPYDLMINRVHNNIYKEGD